MGLSNFDVTPLATLLRQLGEEYGQEAHADLHEFVRRFGNRLPVVAALNALGSRSEVQDMVRRGRAWGGGDNIPAGVGAMSMMQLFNPAASGKRLLVYSVVACAGATALDPTLFMDTAQFALGTAVDAVNKNSAGPAKNTGAGVLRWRDTDGAVPATATQFKRVNCPVNVSIEELQGGEYVELMPGTGLDCLARTLNVAMLVNFAWIEVDSPTDTSAASSGGRTGGIDKPVSGGGGAP